MSSVTAIVTFQDVIMEVPFGVSLVSGLDSIRHLGESSPIRYPDVRPKPFARRLSR